MKKTCNLLLILGTLGVLVLLAGATLFRGLRSPNEYDIYENRRLAQAPQLSLSGLWDGSLLSQTEDFLSDQLAGRTKILKADVRLRLLLGCPSVNDVIVTRDVLLHDNGVYDPGKTDFPAQAAEMTERLSVLRDVTEENGGVFLYVGVPTQRTVFRDRYPAYLNSDRVRTEAQNAAFTEALDRAGIPYLFLNGTYANSPEPLTDLYSSVDHHYTLKGAALGLEEIYRTLETRGLDLSLPADLELYPLDRTFLGTYNRKLYDLSPVSGSLWLYSTDHAPALTRFDNGQKTAPQVFSLPDSGPVTYSVYMGGDQGETVIRTDRPELPKLLIVGDSFTNAMETLAWLSFDELRSLDYRYYNGMDLSDYVRDYQPDVVLVIRDESVYLDLSGNGDLK